MKIKPEFKLLACLIFLLLSHAARCATVSYIPDVTSTQFWQNRTMFVAQVTSGDLTPVPSGPVPSAATGNIACKITDVISGKPAGDTITLSASDAWLWPDPSGETPAIKKGDYVLVIEPNNEHEMPEMLVIKPVQPEPKDPLVESLKAISKINADMSLPNLLEHAASDYDLVSKFCLIQISHHMGDLKAPPDYPAKLQKVADDQKRDGTVRVMADQLVLRMTGLKNDGNGEYSWLVKSIQDYTAKDSEPMRPFMDRMLDLAGKRSDTVKLLTGLCLDPKANMAVRGAAYNAILDKRAFNFAEPQDQESVLIFTTCLAMLNDDGRDIRRVGGTSLQRIISYINNIHPENRDAYAKRAEKGLRDALQKEKDPVAKFFLQINLQNIENPPEFRHPLLKKS